MVVWELQVFSEQRQPSGARKPQPQGQRPRRYPGGAGTLQRASQEPVLCCHSPSPLISRPLSCGVSVPMRIACRQVGEDPGQHCLSGIQQGLSKCELPFL